MTLDAGIGICISEPGWLTTPLTATQWASHGPDGNGAIISLLSPLPAGFDFDRLVEETATEPTFLLREDRRINGKSAPTFVHRAVYEDTADALISVSSLIRGPDNLLSVTTITRADTYDATTAASHDAFLGYITFGAE